MKSTMIEFERQLRAGAIGIGEQKFCLDVVGIPVDEGFHFGDPRRTSFPLLSEERDRADVVLFAIGDGRHQFYRLL